MHELLHRNWSKPEGNDKESFDKNNCVLESGGKKNTSIDECIFLPDSTTDGSGLAEEYKSKYTCTPEKASRQISTNSVDSVIAEFPTLLCETTASSPPHLHDVDDNEHHTTTTL